MKVGFFTEFLAAFFWVLTALLVPSPWAVAGMAAWWHYALQARGGGHANPAFTLAMYLSGVVMLKDVFRYFLAQSLGGIAAALMVWGMRGSALGLSTEPNASLAAMVMIELLLVVVMAWAFLHISHSPTREVWHWLLLAWGYAVAIAVAQVISGGILNPAYTLGRHAMHLLDGTADNVRSIVYVLGQLAGGAVGAYFFYRYHAVPPATDKA